MKAILYLTLGLSSIVYRARTARTEKENVKEGRKEIQELEIEKSELFKQINDAIDDSVRTLQKANDSDALAGIKYIEELKKQISELNGTDDIDSVNYNLEDLLKNRRKFQERDKKNEPRRQLNVGKKVLDPEFDEAKVYGRPGSNKYEEKLANRIIIQKKLDEWLLEREAEKAKIKSYKNSQHTRKLEKCPRFGFVRPRKKDIGQGRSKSKRSGYYPCCRKCCKKSYMGCL